MLQLQRLHSDESLEGQGGLWQQPQPSLKKTGSAESLFGGALGEPQAFRTDEFSQTSPKQGALDAVHYGGGLLKASSTTIFDQAGVQEAAGDCMHPNHVRELNRATYSDSRWNNARKHLFGSRLAMPGDQEIRLTLSVLREGAKAFGLWHVTDASLEGLMRQVLAHKESNQMSPAMATWMALQVKSKTKRTSTMSSNKPSLNKRVSMDEKEVRQELRNLKWKGYHKAIHDGYVHFSENEVLVMKTVLFFIVFVCSVGYAMKVALHMYPGVTDLFSWLVLIARAGGMGSAIVTGVLFLSMSRTAQKEVYSHARFGKISTLFTGHRDLHVFAGKLLMWLALAHTLAHLLGTAPGVQSHTHEELNELLGCANPDTPGHLGGNFSWLTWPSCPLEEDYTLMDVIFKSVPGLTGLALLALLVAIGYTGKQKQRKKHFDRFWYLHNFAIVAWPVLLFVHGSNGWIGVGFPLVVFAAGPFMLSYSFDRVARLLRYYFVARSVRVIQAIIRPGKGGSEDGALTYVRISKPHCMWRFWAGEYAFICMPEYSKQQWHPFTICSGQEDETVDFLIAAVGDWTKNLATRCAAALNGTADLPLLVLDGPYMAPTQSAMFQKVIVAIGAGVGITPFLSLMSTIISSYETKDGHGLKLQEAHFYWMTRNPDELLFGRKLFQKVVNHPKLREKVFFHLHLTRPEPDKNSAALLFREAVRRQSEVDRAAFFSEIKGIDFRHIVVGPQVPWVWVNQSEQDVCWLSHLLPNVDDVEETRVVSSYAGNWAQGLIGPRSASQGNLSSASSLPSHVGSHGSAGSRQSNESGKTGKSDDSAESLQATLGPHWMLPVAFGRPDFGKEVRAIGKARQGDDINVYICGNDQIVKLIQDVCTVCNAHAERDNTSGRAPRQRYWVHHERFG